jgi:uncharacterized iron-regulated membrane protein
MNSQVWGAAVWFHRWAGVGLCLFFAMWFATGAVMVFVPFPALGASERWGSSLPIDLSLLAVAPATIAQEARDASGARLTGIEGRPVYIISRFDAPDSVFAGDTGERLSSISVEVATRIAESFALRPSQSASQAIEYDQWIVYDRFDPVRPFYKVSFADPVGTELYVSALTGEVLQKTERGQRIWNWAGAIPHWIYFTPIRKSWALWDNLVWLLSLVATAAVLVGIVVGIYRLTQARNRSSISPFRGWLRWHHVTGLFFGLFVFTWIFSGWLSMDHGRLFSTPAATRDEVSRFAGATLSNVLMSLPLAAIQELPNVVELNFNAVAGHAIVTAASANAEISVYMLERGRLEKHETVPPALLEQAVATTFPGTEMKPRGTVQPGDFYSTAEELSAGVLLYSGAVTGRDVYVDAVSGRVAAVMDSNRRSYAWLYYALHTFRFPGMHDYPALRTFLLLLLTGIGFAFSVTGVVLAYKRLKG